MPYFGEPVGRVKIQTTSENSQRYYTTKRLIRDLLSNTPNCYVRGENFASIYLRGMRDRSMRSGTKLARDWIQLTDWLTAGNLSNRSSGVQIPRDICTRFGRYLYSTRCSWIIIPNMFFFPRFGGKKWRRSEHAHASYPGLFFRPPGFSPYMGREERRVKGLDQVAQNSFQHFPRRRVWWVIITTLYQLILQSWYQRTAQLLVNTLVLFSWHNRLP